MQCDVMPDVVSFRKMCLGLVKRRYFPKQSKGSGQINQLNKCTSVHQCVCALDALSIPFVELAWYELPCPKNETWILGYSDVLTGSFMNEVVIRVEASRILAPWPRNWP